MTYSQHKQLAVSEEVMRQNTAYYLTCAAHASLSAWPSELPAETICLQTQEGTVLDMSIC